MAPRTDRNNPLNIPTPKIAGTDYDNDTEGVRQLVALHVGLERDRVAANERRARGDYGIELSAADAALNVMNRLEFPDTDFDAAKDVITRAIRYGYDGSDYVADHLDETVEAFNAYASGLATELVKLAEAAYTIRHGRTSSE